MIYRKIFGVPNFQSHEFSFKKNKYCLLIPVINEGERIIKELERAKKSKVSKSCDIIICDGGSIDDSNNLKKLKELEVNTLLIKNDSGKQGAQLRMGFWWALKRGYEGFVTIDGNDKDNIENVSDFIKKIDSGYDFVQGSRFIKGGKAINTPKIRYLATRLIHAPIISFTAKKYFTDTTNAYRAYSKKYITHPQLQIFRDIFDGYELLAYLSVRASQLGLKTCEIPVERKYPKSKKVPTKITYLSGNIDLIKILIKNLLGKYEN